VENLRQKTAQILSDPLSNTEVPSPMERPPKDPPRQETSSPAQPIQMVLAIDGSRLLFTPKLMIVQIYYGVPEQRYDVNWSPYKAPPANAIASEPDWKRAYIPLMVRHLFKTFRLEGFVLNDVCKQQDTPSYLPPAPQQLMVQNALEVHGYILAFLCMSFCPKCASFMFSLCSDRTVLPSIRNSHP
jgi:hypothetical protein